MGDRLTWRQHCPLGPDWLDEFVNEEVLFRFVGYERAQPIRYWLWEHVFTPYIGWWVVHVCPRGYHQTGFWMNWTGKSIGGLTQHRVRGECRCGATTVAEHLEPPDDA